MKQEQTFRQMLESDAYREMTEKVQKERNWGDPHDRYIPDFSVFHKDKKEKERWYNMRAEWRLEIKRLGFTKRNFKQSNVIK